MNSKNGFTLIEIVIVILLIGVLGALFVPRLLQQQDSFKVEAAAEQIANHIRLAQSHAIAQHVTHGVNFDKDNEAYSVYSKTAGPTYTPIKNPLRKNKDLIIDFDSPDSEYYDSNLKDININSAQFPTSSRYSVEFSALGAPNHSGYVNITKGSEVRNIGVELQTGAVSIWE